jgi:hypothetical protein
VYRFAYAAEKKPMKQTQGYNLLLVAVMIAAFLVLVLSLCEGSGEKEAESAIAPAEEEPANANDSSLLDNYTAAILENESAVYENIFSEGLPK